MDAMSKFCLEVSGPFACFTRPEMKVERVSYDVMTPSAAGPAASSTPSVRKPEPYSGIFPFKPAAA